MIEKKSSFCRICSGFCGMEVTLEDGRVTQVRGDKNDPMTRGYTCIKGLQYPELLNGAGRLKRSLKRAHDGTHQTVDVEQAFDEVATRLQEIVKQHGPRAVGVFVGTQGWYNALNYPAATSFIRTLGSPSIYGTMTIDQSAKWVAEGRIGTFNGGPQRFDDADVWMLVGTNPLVSIMGGPSTSGFAHMNPNKALRDAKERGLKLIVIDPRETETARHADLFLRPRPGEDAALLGSIVHVVLKEHWHDTEFCRNHVDGLKELEQAVAPFAPELVSERVDVSAQKIRAAAEMFAKLGKRGMVGTGTGPNMGPHSNLAEHFAQCLNVLCGRYQRAGERVANPGALLPAMPRYADVSAPTRSWEKGARTRRLGLGRMYGQMMSADLADEMLQPGKDQLRALICVGSNPAVALPDQHKAVRALTQLDLLVTLDPRMSATARLSDYVIAPTLAFERHDHTGFLEGGYLQPFARYAEPICDVPEGSQFVDEWQFFWEVAKRMQLPMRMGDLQCGPGESPTTEQVIRSMTKDARVTLDEIRSMAVGGVFASDAVVQPAREGHDARLQLVAPDVLDEISQVAGTLHEVPELGNNQLMLTVRRIREFSNSVMSDTSASRARFPEIPAYVHPDEMLRLNLQPGQRVLVSSGSGSMHAIVHADDSMRMQTVAVPHCWGFETAFPEANGLQLPKATSALVSSESHLQSINGMPVMTAIPVHLSAVDSV